METLLKGIARPIVDGGGLCSPGRWPLHRRNLPQSPLVAELRNILWKGYLEFTSTFENKDARRQLMKVACGHCVDSPFRKQIVEATRETLRTALKRGGLGEGRPRKSDRPQEFEVRLIGELAKHAEIRMPNSPNFGQGVCTLAPRSDHCHAHRPSSSAR